MNGSFGRRHGGQDGIRLFFYHNLPCPPSYDEVFHINILVRKPAVKERETEWTVLACWPSGGRAVSTPYQPGFKSCLAESISPLYFGWVSHTCILICWHGVPPPLLSFLIGRLKGHPLKLGYYATQYLPRHFFTQLDMMIFTFSSSQRSSSLMCKAPFLDECW
jgi:hypothetical protein